MQRAYQADPSLVVEPAYYSGGVPVFEPTMAQFRDFYKYNKAINEYGMRSGIVKVVPPPEWLADLRGTYSDESLSKIVIKNPIVQNMNASAGYKGVFSSQNVEKQRKFSISQWKSLSQKPNHMPPAHKSRRRGSPCPEDKELVDGPGLRVHARRRLGKSSGPRVIDEVLEGDFNIDAREFSGERCEELELLYWKSLGYAEPMYGADMLGSLFRESTESWNVAKLPNLLDLMEEKIPGVNDAYLYAGLWKATFSWHLEDQDLYSINYIHFGAPKQWYAIPQSQNKKFYTLMLEIFDEDHRSCPEFLRHKTFLASPQFLEKHGITCNKIVHRQGEFMITYPYGYHAGFNYGYNLAESVNFALDDWLDYAQKARKCECIEDSVGINYEQISCLFRGLPYPPKAAAAVHSVLPRGKSAGRGVAGSTSRLRPMAAPAAPAKKQCVEKKKAVQVTEPPQCALCPRNLHAALLSLEKFHLLNTSHQDPRTGQPLQVHRICAEMFRPLVEIVPASAGPQAEVVTGIESIARPYRSLKCLVCRVPNRLQAPAPAVPRGACFQCSAARCAKAYHATCALAAGFLFGPGCCKTHRPSVSQYFERQDARLHAALACLPPDSMVQYSFPGPGRRHTGKVQCGLVLGNSAARQTLEVACFPELAAVQTVHYDDVIMGAGSAAQADNADFVGMARVARANTGAVGALRLSSTLLEPEASPEPHVTEQHPLAFASSNYSFATQSTHVAARASGQRSYVFVEECPGDMPAPSQKYNPCLLVSDVG